MSDRPVILGAMGAFWPGNDSSGPNQSFRAMADALSPRFDIRLIARDRPFGAAARLPNIGEGWNEGPAGRAAYLPVGRWGAQGLGGLLDATPHDLLHLNGFHDREFTIPALIRRRVRPAAPVLLSPRGEFSEGALSLGASRKKIYRAVTRLAGLLRGVTLHATSEAELADLRRAFPRQRIELVPNFRPIFALPEHDPRPDGAPLRVAFIGRISPVKGLDIALDALSRVRVPARFEIFGPVQDEAHWRLCETAIARLPDHVEAVAMGEIANADVAAAMARQDLMLLPSLSENFGHGIFEALAAGTPVLIGDRTPWRDLAAKRAGFDQPLADREGLTRRIEQVAAWPAAERATWRAGARSLAEAYVAGSPALPAMTALYESLIAEGAK